VQHVDERLRSTADWLADAVDPSGALERVRRKKARRRIVRRAEATALAVVVLAATAGGLLVLARVFGLGTKPRPAAVLGDRSVAFVSDQDGDNEIYAIEGDGRPTRLTDNDADDRAPAWSPDGTRLAFLRREGQAFFVYIMNSDGTEARRVTQPGPGDVVAGKVSGETMWFSRLSWFPDSSRIAFGGREVGLPCPAEGCPYQDLDIFSVGIDESDLVNLTDTNATDEKDPSLAPDDDTIVFVRTLRQEGDPPPPGRIPQLYIMDPDAPGVGRLTDLPGSAVNPAWSPDGTRIAFEGDGDIYVMNADATGLRRLAVLPPPDAGNAAPHPSYGNYEPSWSPDGTKIVFASDRDGDRDLYVMPATGTEDQAVRLTDSPAEEYEPAWEPSPNEGDATPSPLAPSSECPELDEESPDLPDSYRRVGKPLGGDVTGDGRDDRASILGNEDAPPRCRYFVVLEGVGGSVYLARITPIEWLPDVPSLLMGADIDGQAGLELVVDFGGPMHPHRTGQVFSFDDGALIQMRTKGDGYGMPHLFPLHDEFVGSVDCTGEPGTIVVTDGAFADGGNDDGHYEITRTFYRAEGAVFVEIREENYTVEVGTERERWPELADDPFRSCPSD
jgi:Tol biopolymer transport system component